MGISDVRENSRDFVGEVFGISGIFNLGSVFGGLRGRFPCETVNDFRSIKSELTLEVSGEFTSSKQPKRLDSSGWNFSSKLEGLRNRRFDEGMQDVSCHSASPELEKSEASEHEVLFLASKSFPESELEQQSFSKIFLDGRDKPALVPKPNTALEPSPVCVDTVVGRRSAVGCRFLGNLRHTR